MVRPRPFNTRLITSSPGRALLRAGVFAIAVVQERRHIARGSTKGVQRVDVRTGAAPSLRQTTIVLGTQSLIRWLGRVIPGPGTSPARPDPGLTREIEQARSQHADDPDALQDAVMRIYRERRVAPGNALVAGLVRSLTITAIGRRPLPFVSERRTIADMLAGTKILDGGPSRWTRWRERGR